MTVIVIGAGASGLAAGAALARAGLHVVVLEARGRVGGRIDTRTDERLGIPIEFGAEFVHGRPPVVTRLSKRGHVHLREIDGRVLAFQRGALRPADHAFERMHALLELEGEGPFSVVPRGGKDGRFTPLERALARGFVEGYYLASPRHQGRAALRTMTKSEEAIEADRAFRPLEGQKALLAPLARAIERVGELRLSTQVEAVSWSRGRVEARARGPSGRPVGPFRGERLVVTLPAALLARGTVKFAPALEEKRRAASKLETGPLVKVLLRFREPFWHERTRKALATPDLAFAIAPGFAIPTWWTLKPIDAPVLVGWAGGPAASRLPADPRRILRKAVSPLARMFNRDTAAIEDVLDGAEVVLWHADPLAGGAYAVFPPGTSKVPELLAKPVARTLFFAGEATTLGAAGTVHGALETGVRAAREVMASL